MVTLPAALAYVADEMHGAEGVGGIARCAVARIKDETPQPGTMLRTPPDRVKGRTVETGLRPGHYAPCFQRE